MSPSRAPQGKSGIYKYWSWELLSVYWRLYFCNVTEQKTPVIAVRKNVTSKYWMWRSCQGQYFDNKDILGHGWALSHEVFAFVCLVHPAFIFWHLTQYDNCRTPHCDSCPSPIKCQDTVLHWILSMILHHNASLRKELMAELTKRDYKYTCFIRVDSGSKVIDICAGLLCKVMNRGIWF